MESRNYANELELDYLFHPQSLAIIGLSSDSNRMNIGQEYLQALLSFGYKGKIYPVGLGGGEIFGIKIYPSIKDIPDTVDYVISAIPAVHTIPLIADCAGKGVKAIQIFTAGFSEIEDEEGGNLQAQLVANAKKTGIRIIGPNCFGLYCPKIGLTFPGGIPDGGDTKSGSVGFISQSGGNGAFVIREGVARGIYFSKVISYGNACDLDEIDFLEYLAHDPETKIITSYIEGIKEGRKFIQTLREAAKLKPVIICKGGTSDSGARAAASHTGSMAGGGVIWSSLLKQMGALQVNSMEELLDIVLLFMHVVPPKGRNTAIIGVGGGASVQAADVCSNAGLVVPALPAEIRRKLKECYTSEVGGSFRNPVDMYWGRRDLFQETIRMVASCEQIDLLIIHAGFTLGLSQEQEQVRQITEDIISLKDEIHKCTVVVLDSIWVPESKKATIETQRVLNNAGFPFYFSVSQAANALSKFIQYHQVANM